MTTWQQVEALAKKHGYDSYYHYLQSDHWKNLSRQKKLNSACCVCSINDQLIAHHIRYKDLLDVLLEDLAVLCKRCHEDFHLACREFGIDYVDVEIPRIITITYALRIAARKSEIKQLLESKF